MLRIGTCSWKYDSWEGLVYSDKKGINFLREYSAIYNTVEIDQWFWSLHGINNITLPQKDTVLEYNNSVPEEFKFTIKIPNSITLTHQYLKNKGTDLTANPHFLSPDLFNAFFDSIEPLHSKIGALMFQFEYLNKLKMGSVQEFIEKFEAFTERINPEARKKLAVEIRNPNYLVKPFFDFIFKKDIGSVLLEGYYMPPIWETFSKFREQLISPLIIRLHGPNRKEIETASNGKWNKILEPKDEALAKVSLMIEYFKQKNTDVYVNVNNHFEGSAPLTIERLQNQLKSLST